MHLKKSGVFISYIFISAFVSAQNHEVGFSTMELKNLNWNPGISIQNNDKSFRLKWGGRIQYDHAFFRQNKELDRQEGKLASGNGTEFRRVWLSNAGTLYQNTDFGINVSFEGGRVAFRGVYLKLSDSALGGQPKDGSNQRTTSLRGAHEQQPPLVFRTNSKCGLCANFQQRLDGLQRFF